MIRKLAVKFTLSVWFHWASVMSCGRRQGGRAAVSSPRVRERLCTELNSRLVTAVKERGASP